MFIKFQKVFGDSAFSERKYEEDVLRYKTTVHQLNRCVSCAQENNIRTRNRNANLGYLIVADQPKPQLNRQLLQIQIEETRQLKEISSPS